MEISRGWKFVDNREDGAESTLPLASPTGHETRLDSVYVFSPTRKDQQYSSQLPTSQASQAGDIHACSRSSHLEKQWGAGSEKRFGISTSF